MGGHFELLTFKPKLLTHTDLMHVNEKLIKEIIKFNDSCTS